MTRNPLVLTLSAALLGAPLQTAAQQPAAGGGDQVRVLVFNIQAGKDSAGLGNLAEVSRIIGETEADVVLLQEVDQNALRSWEQDQVAVLSAITGMQGAFGKTNDVPGGAHGLAVLSRWPVEVAQGEGGGEAAANLPNVFQATVAVPSGPLTVLSAHVDSATPASVGPIRDAANRAMSAGPTVLGGGFGIDPSPALEALSGLQDGWTSCAETEGEGNNYPIDEPSMRLTYVFLGGGVRCTSGRVIEAGASDQLPVLVVLGRN